MKAAPDPWPIVTDSGAGMLHVIQDCEGFFVDAAQDGLFIPYVEVVNTYFVADVL